MRSQSLCLLPKLPKLPKLPIPLHIRTLSENDIQSY
jgi:hypothetical protein